jgi:L-ascorbate metabolism protein UlaG (beta-lactamase superfamily)
MRALSILAATAGLAVVAGTTVAVRSTGWLVSFGGPIKGERQARLAKSPHYDARTEKFHNLLPTDMVQPGSYWQMLRHQLFGDEVRVPPRPVPVQKRTPADYASPPASGLRATWMGHATTLVEIDQRRVLFDPIFSERCSPSTLVGPRRFHPPPISLADLPPIDAVVISHDHFDHLDMATIKALAAHGSRFFVPLGIGAHLEAWDVPLVQITELDWDEAGLMPGLTITAKPARHYSGRSPLRGDQTLWASWVLVGPIHKVFFSGDSGYFNTFQEVGAKYGPIDLTLIKIGASDPTWEQIHMSPADAVKAHQDLRGKLLLPVHWGTFNLAFHDWNAPALQLTAAAQKAGLRPGIDYVIPAPGQFVDVAAPPAVDDWWR